MIAARLTSDEEELKKNIFKEEVQQNLLPDNKKPAGWSYIEVYTKSIRAVECMLKLDRLRQESAMFNMLAR